MKKLSVLLALLFTFIQGFAQSPIYYFNVATDTAYESNANVIAGYVKTNTAPTKLDSVYVVLTSGSPRPTHMDTASIYTIYFSAGQDSAPFVIQIMKDTFPEYPEHVVYDLRSSASGSPVGTDSSLTFVLIDTTPPAIIGYILDSTWAFADLDTFIGGVHYTIDNPAYTVGIRVNNPNPFFIRYYADNIDCFHNSNYPFVNACALTDFFFNGETCYAPPGISIYYKIANIVTEDNSTTNKYFLCNLSNIDDNIISDSFVFFTIRPVDFYNPPSISFDTPAVTIKGDTNLSFGIPITVTNTNRRPLYYVVDTIQTSSSFPGIDYTIGNQDFGFGNGITHDTIWLNLINRNLIDDTIKATFVIRPDTINTMGRDTLNTSADTLFYLTIIDSGSLQVSFYGAGFSYLKSDSIGYVKVYSSVPVKYPVSVDVSYLNGSAIRDTDFIFNDTTVIFPAYSYDTVSLPVIMLQDHIHSGNTQINLGLSNVNPYNTQYGISQFTYIIIDDEDSGLPALGIDQITALQDIDIYPNPTDGEISIKTILASYHVSVTNVLGETIYDLSSQSGDMSLSLTGQPPGVYLVRIWNTDHSYTKKVLKL